MTITKEQGWTVETLKEHIDRRFIDLEVAADQRFDAQQLAVKDALINQEKAVTSALLASEKAIIKAEILTDKRFDAVTDAVAAVSVKTAELLPRAEYQANHGALNDKIMVVTDSLNRSSGDKNLYATNAYVTQTVSQAMDNLESKIVNIITPLVDYVSSQKGAVQSNKSSNDTLFKIIAAIGSILGILGVFVAVVIAVMK